MKKGDIVKGHFCYECLKHVDPAYVSKSNPEKYEYCLKCGHIRYGRDSTGLVGDWLIIGRSNHT